MTVQNPNHMAWVLQVKELQVMPQVDMLAVTAEVFALYPPSMDMCQNVRGHFRAYAQVLPSQWSH